MSFTRIALITLLTLSSPVIFGQPYNLFLDAYTYHKNNLEPRANNQDVYHDIQGSPYLNSEFTEGIIYLKDTAAFKLPLRFNIYTNEMEYRVNGVNYIVGNPQSLKKIELGGSVFIFLPAIPKRGYYELLQTGKCILIQERTVSFTPSEGPKPIVGTITPARFSKDSDIFFMFIGDSGPVEVKNMKSLLAAMQDQRANIETYIKQEKIKSAKKENLIRITAYYNSLSTQN